MSQINYDHFKVICQGGGLKATSQRFVIFKSLVESALHPTADQLFEQVTTHLPALSRDTVYRTLNSFWECGLVRKLTMPGGATHFDGDLSPHHHFLCERCGKIFDLVWPQFESLQWPSDCSRIGRPRNASVLILGSCLACTRFDSLSQETGGEGVS